MSSSARQFAFARAFLVLLEALGVIEGPAQPEDALAYRAGRIERALAEDRRIHELGVCVEVERGVVYPRGEVAGERRRRLIGEVAREVAPELAVRNEVSVRPHLVEIGAHAEALLLAGDLTHYVPVAETLAGEPPEIYPFLGSYFLAEAINRAGADLAVHCHAHAHAGQECGVTPGGTEVRNVALPVLRRAYAVYAPGAGDGALGRVADAQRADRRRVSR
jgi:hypothetical protein